LPKDQVVHSPDQSARSTNRRRGRAIAFRCAALLLGLTPLIALELLFAALDWGRTDASEDPFVGFHGSRPLFVLNQDGTRYEIPPSRQAFFRPQSFSAQKAPDGYRIFCLGGSTVQGRPYATETAFGKWLEIALQTAEPQRTWEVVNCGGVSYASYRLVPILQEVLQYEPDLIVLCTGHNEFLEDRTYGHVREQSAAVVAVHRWASQLRTYHLLRAQYLRLRSGDLGHQTGDRPTLSEEVEARLDYRGGLGQYHRDEKWHRDVVAHFRANVERMIRLAQESQVPLLIVNPASDLRDTPPFKSEHSPDLSADQAKRWDQLLEEARSHYGTNLRRTVALLEEALQIDDQHAGLHYQIGQCYDALGDLEQAREHYLLAKELDVCPLRMLEPMHEALLDVAAGSGTPVVDARELITGLCRGGIPDQSWMVDHVHPSIRGHQKIADAIAEWLVQQGALHPHGDWRQQREGAYQAHWDSLEPIYFETGRQRLEVLRDWARGRMTKERKDQ
jgi:lysophospholipase L1-like esterase